MNLMVVIPVYNTPKRLSTMLTQLLNDGYPHTEIVVAIDGGMTPAITAALEPFRSKITLHDNHAHLGKVETLNRIGLASQADILLFLDNDVVLSEDRDFLSKLVRQMARVDIAEIPKEAIVTSFISSMIRYEFLGFAIATWLFAALGKRCPSMNGAAFAVRQTWFARLHGFRAVINEDMDFAARAFREKARFGYDRNLKIQNEVPVNLDDWLRQRKRWAFNNLSWLKTHFLYFITNVFKTPRLIVPLLLLFLPFIVVGAVFVLMRHMQLTAILPFVFMIIQHFHGFAGVFLWITHYHLLLNDGLIPTGIALGVSILSHYGFARYFRFQFNFLHYLFFYFIYSPIWILVNLIIWIMAVMKLDVQLEWKV